MIVFDLSCSCGCQFEGWFRDGHEFTRQEREGLLVCPACEGREVRKILSPVATSSARRGSRADQQPGLPSSEQQAAAALRALQDYVAGNFEDVGAKLAQEALKIHYGLEEPRNIRGRSTEEEEKVLEKEGIGILKIPMPVKDEKN